MQTSDDMALVREFAASHSETAFATLVTRHLGLVYSAAMRQVGDPHLAEEITQAVFIILARKAATLRAETLFTGWLFKTTRYAALEQLRIRARRQRLETEASMDHQVAQIPEVETPWPRLAPLLDEALAGLGETDRRALLLRYFEGRSLAETGAALALTEDAARKRVARGLDKLRRFFKRRGVTLTTAVIASALAANAVQAAPAGLAASVALLAVKPAAVTLSLGSLAQGTLKALAWAKYKSLMAYGSAALVAGTALVAVLPHPSAHAPGPVPPPPTSRQEPLADIAAFTLDSPPGGLALQADGKIVVGTTLFGEFFDTNSGSLGFYSRGALRLNPDGTVDRSFLFDVGRSDSAAQQANVNIGTNGEMLVSGVFHLVNHVARPGYALLQPNGSLDETFEPWRGRTNLPGSTGLAPGVAKSAWLPDGSIAVMSESVEPNITGLSQYPPTAYRLDTTGRWIPPTTNILAGTFSRPSGLITTLGSVGFWARHTIDWSNSTPAAQRPPVRYGSQILALSNSPPVYDLPFDIWGQKPSAPQAALVLQALFEEVPLELCRYAVRLPDGGAILAVRDRAVDGSMTAPGRFMRFDKDWRPDFSFSNHYEADLRSELRIKRQSDGKFLVGGLMGRMNGAEFPGLVRLLENGQIDPGFHCTTTNDWSGRVMDMVIQMDGRIVICGFFNAVNGAAVPHIARLNPDGSLDGTFKPPFITMEQFDRNRLGSMHRVPVTPLTRILPQTMVTRPPQTILITTMRLDGGAASIQYAGTPGQRYVLQASETLAATGWSTISTNVADNAGRGSFRDPDASSHPSRFYRIATP